MKGLRARFSRRSEEGPGRRIARQSGWLASAQLVAAPLLFLQSVMVTRALGAESYGVFVLVITFTMTVIQIFDSRVWESITRYLPRYRARGELARAAAVLRLGYLIELGAALVALALVLGAAELAARLLLDSAESAGRIRLFSLLILLRAPQEATIALLRVADRFDWLSYQQVGVSLIKTLGVALVWWWAPSVEGMLIVQLVGSALGVATLLVMGRQVARSMGLRVWRGSLRSALGDEAAGVLRFTLLTNLTGTSRVITSRADNLILGLLGSPAAVGLYDLARQLTANLTNLSQPLQASVFPELSKLVAAGDGAGVRALLRRLTRGLVAVVVPVCVAVALVAPWLVTWVFGAEFEPSGPLLQILVWQLLWLPVLWFPGLLLVSGRPGMLTALNWIDAALYVVLLWTLVSGLGALGAALATLSRQLLWIMVVALAMQRLELPGAPALDSRTNALGGDGPPG